MARSPLTNLEQDLIDDGGSVLFSFIKGEQLEFPITLSFATTTFSTSGYTFEAVVVEALNVDGQTEKPTQHKPSGVQNTLVVRSPVYLGTWSSVTAYNMEDVVFYNSKYYKLKSGAGYVSAVTPDVNSQWLETTANRIYVQFPSTLSLSPGWEITPTVGSPVYGFFELRVTEPNNSIFRKTWKPVRGMVEILFSPTAIVPDA